MLNFSVCKTQKIIVIHCNNSPGAQDIMSPLSNMRERRIRTWATGPRILRIQSAQYIWPRKTNPLRTNAFHLHDAIHPYSSLTFPLRLCPSRVQVHMRHFFWRFRTAYLKHHSRMHQCITRTSLLSLVTMALSSFALNSPSDHKGRNSSKSLGTC